MHVGTGLSRRYAERINPIRIRAAVNSPQLSTLALVHSGEPREQATTAGRNWLARMGLEEFDAAYPSRLSGGMKRRVAIAQNWILDRPMILMDEPFSALDVHTRMQMERELVSLWAGSPKTILFVTHDACASQQTRLLVRLLGDGTASLPPS